VRPHQPALEIRHLSVTFATRQRALLALDDVSFSIARGETLGLVGESGAGKSVTGAAIIGLINGGGRITGGEIYLDGLRIDSLGEAEWRKIRGRRIGTIFQDPLTSLNPLLRIGAQLTETLQTHLDMTASQARERALALLAEVGIPDPAGRFDAYPHQFSGGMRQRVVIALALCGQPEVVIADEPTTALDVSVQAQIITLLQRLCRERRAALLLITHDMGVIAKMADRVAVMYAGRIVEMGKVRSVVGRPLHPYAQGLMRAVPPLSHRADRLMQIDGAMPRLAAIPSGCAFHSRCSRAVARCQQERPELAPYADGRVACHVYGP
jgi:peptide/nickel transport system ATP-binding protein